MRIPETVRLTAEARKMLVAIDRDLHTVAAPGGFRTAITVAAVVELGLASVARAAETRPAKVMGRLVERKLDRP